MSRFEYDKEEEERKLRKAEYEAGREEGIKEGREVGKKEGIKEGRAAGKKEGELKKARETAIILNQMNFPVEKIAEALQVQEDVIEEWIRENVVEFFRKNKE